MREKHTSSFAEVPNTDVDGNIPTDDTIIDQAGLSSSTITSQEQGSNRTNNGTTAPETQDSVSNNNNNSNQSLFMSYLAGFFKKAKKLFLVEDIIFKDPSRHSEEVEKIIKPYRRKFFTKLSLNLVGAILCAVLITAIFHTMPALLIVAGAGFTLWNIFNMTNKLQTQCKKDVEKFEKRQQREQFKKNIEENLDRIAKANTRLNVKVNDLVDINREAGVKTVRELEKINDSLNHGSELDIYYDATPTVSNVKVATPIEMQAPTVFVKKGLYGSFNDSDSDLNIEDSELGYIDENIKTDESYSNAPSNYVKEDETKPIAAQKSATVTASCTHSRTNSNDQLRTRNVL